MKSFRAMATAFDESHGRVGSSVIKTQPKPEVAASMATAALVERMTELQQDWYSIEVVIVREAI